LSHEVLARGIGQEKSKSEKLLEGGQREKSTARRYDVPLSWNSQMVPGKKRGRIRKGAKKDEKIMKEERNTY